MKLKPLVVGLAAAGMAATAQAEPVTAAVAAIGAAMGGTAGAYMIMNAAAVAAGVLKVGALAMMTLYSRSKAKRAAARARDAYNASLTDRNQTLVQADLPCVYIYGRATVQARVVHTATTGDKDQYKHIVIAWADHECDAIEDIQFNGVSIAANADGWATDEKWSKTEQTTRQQGATISSGGEMVLPTGTVQVVSVGRSREDGYEQLPPSEYDVTDGVLRLKPGAMENWAGASVILNYAVQSLSSQVRVRHHLGAPDQLADEQLIADTAGLEKGRWRSTDRMCGICYSVVWLDLNNAELQSGLPQVTATIRGKQVLDPRSGLIAWSDNAALCAHDFLLSDVYGKGVPQLQIVGVVAAANACDELITVVDGSETVTAPRYTCNGSWTSEQDPDAVLADIAASMAGFAIPGGVWTLQAGVYTPPVMHLDERAAVGSISMIPAPPRAEAWNGAKGQYYNPKQYNLAVDYEPLQVPQYVEDDGGEVWGSLSMPFSDSGWRARTLASISVEQSRSKSLVWRGHLACLRATVGARVLVTHSLLGLVGESFRVASRRFVHGEKVCVELTLTQDKPAYYLAVSNTVQGGDSSQADVVYRVLPPSGLVLTSPAAGQIRVSVDPSIDLLVANGGQLLVQLRLEEVSDWISAPPASAATHTQIVYGLTAGRYIVQVDWQNSRGQQSGQWQSDVVTVDVGAWAAPDDVESVLEGSMQDPSDSSAASKGWVKQQITDQVDSSIQSSDPSSLASKEWVLQQINA